MNSNNQEHLVYEGATWGTFDAYNITSSHTNPSDNTASVTPEYVAPVDPHPRSVQQQGYNNSISININPQETVFPHSELPPGWLSLFDDYKRPYYINTTTRISQWEHPSTGLVDNPYLASYECPSYYHHQVRVQQTSENKSETYTDPNYDAYKGSQPAPTDLCHPSYYDRDIAQFVNTEVLTSDQLDQLNVQYIDSGKYLIPLTFQQKTIGTCAKLPLLTILTVLLFAIGSICAGLFFSGFVAEPLIFIPVGIVYLVYFVSYVLNAGLFPLFWVCCGRTGWGNSEKIVESLRSQGSTEKTLLRAIESIVSATPQLRLIVQCYHYESRTRSVSNTITHDDGSTSTEWTTETYEEKVTTYEGYRNIPILRYRDLSAPAGVVGDIISQCSANLITVSYNYLYETHPSQHNMVATLRKQFYYQHSYRDDHCDVTSHYTLSCLQPDCSTIIKEINCSYIWRLCAFFNPLSFFLWAYAGLFIVPAIAFRSYARCISFDNVKYLHLGQPNSGDDVCTYSTPRWSWRWDWYTSAPSVAMSTSVSSTGKVD